MTSNLLPKWQNSADSGHTALYLKSLMCFTQSYCNTIGVSEMSFWLSNRYPPPTQDNGEPGFGRGSITCSTLGNCTRGNIEIILSKITRISYELNI